MNVDPRIPRKPSNPGRSLALAIALATPIACWDESRPADEAGATQPVAGQIAEAPDSHDTVTQLSTIDALVQGIYQKLMMVDEMKLHGDFGLGTYEHLDGEMIQIDGEILRISADGIARAVPPKTGTPFFVTTFFEPDETLELKDVESFSDLSQRLSEHLPSRNIPYAFRVEGSFTYVKTRSVPSQPRPYPPLAEVAVHQPTFELIDTSGSMVGFRFPTYMEGLNVAGDHIHFLTRDRSGGGHVLELRAEALTIHIDHSYALNVLLPENDSEFMNLDLEEDRSEEVKKVER